MIASSSAGSERGGFSDRLNCLRQLGFVKGQARWLVERRRVKLLTVLSRVILLFLGAKKEVFSRAHLGP